MNIQSCLHWERVKKFCQKSRGWLRASKNSLSVKPQLALSQIWKKNRKHIFWIFFDKKQNMRYLTKRRCCNSGYFRWHKYIFRVTYFPWITYLLFLDINQIPPSTSFLSQYSEPPIKILFGTARSGGYNMAMRQLLCCI